MLYSMFIQLALPVRPTPQSGVFSHWQTCHLRFLSPLSVSDEKSLLMQFPVAVNLSVQPATPQNALH